MEPDHRWLGVELRHLVALEAVAREGSFGRAARSLGYTQSAISQQIATLERIVGERLLERPGGPRRVSLTEAGELLLRHGQAIVSRLSAAQADLDALANGEAGTLAVGVFQSIGARVLPELLRRFRESWPRVEIRLEEAANDADLLALVEQGRLDLTFADLPLPEGPFEEIEVFGDPYVLLVPADSPLAARRRAPAPAEIAELDLIGFRHCRTFDHVESLFPERLGFVFRSDHNDTVQGLVGAGFGAAIVPRLTIEPHDDSVVALDLSATVPRRRIGVAWHRDRHRGPAARAFVDAALEVCAELEPQDTVRRPEKAPAERPPQRSTAIAAKR